MGFLDSVIERGEAKKKVLKQFPKVVYECDVCGARFKGKCLHRDYGVTCGADLRPRFKHPKGRFVAFDDVKNYPAGFLVKIYECGWCSRVPPRDIRCFECGKGHLIVKESV